MQTSNKELTKTNKVLVVGGGLGGIQTALDLAEAEKDVILIDQSFAIGGLMTQLDRTFPTNNCDICTISPHLSDSSHRDRIEMLPLTSVESVRGEKGNFTVVLRTEPRHINMDKCTACGVCREQYPDCVNFTPGLDHRAPTCMRYPQVTPQAFSIDLKKCDDVPGLVKCCPVGAINPDDIPRLRTINCASMVLTPGAALFDPSHLDYLGYAQFPDVVTSLEYERILSASGPTGGKLVRPSNGEAPKKIAWIQCIGSRGLQKGSGAYCSHACCMFALKEAIVTKERFQEDIETTIFYMDMRTFGKNYELYLDRAKNDVGVRLVRSRPHSIIQKEGSEQLTMTYHMEDTTAALVEDFDMIVLSTGFKTTEETKALAAKVGIELNDSSFPVTNVFNPVATSKPGIYVAGTFEAPKDIPETLVQASAAACMAGIDLPKIAEAPVETAETEEAEAPVAERDVTGEEPKIGVFICDCAEGGKVLNIDSLVQATSSLPQVASVKAIGHGCSRDAIQLIQDTIKDEQLNRVVIGGCSPRTQQVKFEQILTQAGLNKYLLEIANIRDQASWVHSAKPEAATAKAQELLKMAVGAVAKAQPLVDKKLPMNKDVLVVGGGVSGMTASLQLAEQGFQVQLVEKEAELGGTAKGLNKTIEGGNVKAFVKELTDKVAANANIKVTTQAEVVDHAGLPGMFTTGLQVGADKAYTQLSHGATILATGALQNRPAQYLLGDSPAVMTQYDTQQYLVDNSDAVKAWENVVMIQCVGSRVPENPNCSRICCQNSIKNALAILEINPDARIFILYRDMRSYGFLEEYYQKARAKGVIFARYSLDKLPTVAAAGDKVEVTYYDTIISREVTISADNLSLSTGLVADTAANAKLARIFKLPQTEDGFFLEEHVKLRPVELPVPGFYVAGTAHSPKLIKESVIQANAVAAKAQTLLARDEINLGAAAAQVDGNLCAACLICVRACPFSVPFINSDGYSQIDPAKCHGCGICVSECPAKAIQLMQFEDDRILAKVEQLFERISA